MELSFENHHVVAIVVFMIALLFCKQMLECMNNFLDAWHKCAVHSCCCCDYGHEELLRGGLTAALLTFSVCQPILFVLVNSLAMTIRGKTSFWTVNFVHVEFNASAFKHRNTATEAIRRPLEQGVSVATTQVDGLLLVMPFALCAFCTTNTWFGLKASGEFSKDPHWDAELFQNRRMQLYEALYGLETLLLLFALLALSADPAQPEYTAVSALLATFIIMYFSAQSRTRSTSDRTSESLISIFLFAALNMLLSGFVTQHWSSGGTVKLLSTCMLALTTLVLAAVHMTAAEDTLAGTVILLRTLLSCSGSMFFTALLAADANSLA
jgi:hypothetical protein